jgi:hypothetical protein
MGRELKREHPAADSLLLPSPHWPTALDGYSYTFRNG